MAESEAPEVNESESVEENLPVTEEQAKTDKKTPKPKTSFKQKLSNLKTWSLANKKKSIPLAIVLVLVVVTLIPQTRYLIPGLFMKRDISIQVENSNFDSAVSDAEVTVAGVSAKTNGRGVAKLKQVPLGNHTAVIAKKYYKTVEEPVTVGFGDQQSATFEMESEGALVELTVNNKISGKGVEAVEIKSGESEAKTDEDGKTVLVLPFGTKEAEVALTRKGYVATKTKVAVSDNEIKKQTLTITPEGKIYFLSKASGKIDVVKTNLDGTDRKVILAGTGKEDEYDTVLLASTDWKYLALKSKRDGGENSKIFLIETATDSVSNIDEGNANFSVYGWTGKHLVYLVDRKVSGQKEKYRLKSYDAEAKKITVIDRTEAVYNDNGYGYSWEPYDEFTHVILAGDKVYYTKLWQNKYDSSGSEKDRAYSVKPDGTEKKTLITGPPDRVYPYNLRVYLYRPYEMYISGYDNYESRDRYYEWELDAPKAEEITNKPDEVAKFSQTYPTYLISPSGKQNLWSEDRDGKTFVFVGDDKGENGKQIARLSEYLQYGWYTNEYLLFSKNGSELYIMSNSELEDGKEPIKISDYHKPSYSYYGYGGGYGGY